VQETNPNAARARKPQEGKNVHTLRERITAAICRELGHTHPGIDSTQGIPAERCNDGLLADAALSALTSDELAALGRHMTGAEVHEGLMRIAHAVIERWSEALDKLAEYDKHGHTVSTVQPANPNPQVEVEGSRGNTP